MDFDAYVSLAAKTVEGAGVAVILVGAAVAGVGTVVARARGATDPYRLFRQRLGRVILVGLELLVAADIIRTVSHDPTITGVAVLAGIVVIRTFLSFTLEMEIEGRWPWQHDQRAPPQNT